MVEQSPAPATAAPVKRPRVSVVIPTYNRADLVGHAIRSALDQTMDDLEVIVVDDGSTDGTPDVLARFADPRVRVIHQANKGISSALNTGFRAAAGDAVIMLGSDDRFLPYCLARLVAALDAHPDAVLVYGRAQAMDDLARPLPQITGNPEPFPGQTLRSILYGDFVATIAALTRRDALFAVGLCDERLSGNEDWDLWIRLATRGPFVFVDTVLAQFRVHPTRFTAARGEALAHLTQGRLAILDKAFARPDLPPDARAVRPLAYRNAYIDAGLRWLAVGGRPQALDQFRRALRYGNPLATLARIVYLAVIYRFIGRFGLVRAVSDTVFRGRRALRSLWAKLRKKGRHTR